MRKVLILTGILGGGTALTFAAAALAATMFPNGTTVTSGGWDTRGGWVNEKGWVEVAPAPVPWDTFEPVPPDVNLDPGLDVGDG